MMTNKERVLAQTDLALRLFTTLMVTITERRDPTKLHFSCGAFNGTTDIELINAVVKDLMSCLIDSYNLAACELSESERYAIDDFYLVANTNPVSFETISKGTELTKVLVTFMGVTSVFSTYIQDYNGGQNDHRS
jgi:hypothetical protein